ncbi:GNAT family N-acetyltransferase [Candidatus Bathyarchaeota archaeon]|nr:GNAT family N-acetyltransferase [Candidatus Bathyarchaeota archaeon]
MKIIEVNNYQDFLSLKNEWANLLEKCDHTVFSTWEWLSTWWKYFGSDKKLILLLATKNDEIIGIAPLMYSTRKVLGFNEGKIAFIGTPHTDYNDFIIADERNECIRLFIEYLKKLPEKWSYIELSEIPENSKSLPILSKLSNTLKASSVCPYKPLPKSIDAFRASLSRNMKRNLRRYMEKAKKEFEVEFSDYSKVESCIEGMHLLFKLHQKEWTSKGYPGVFANINLRNFHLEIAKIFAGRRWLGLFLLKLSGRPAAVVYGFKDQRKFYGYLSGFDPIYSKYSVGNLLIAHVIEKCIEEGLSEFDFMRGDEKYKVLWETILRWNQTAIISRSGILSNTWRKLYLKIWDSVKTKYFCDLFST